jgi:hypothetical protein
LSVNFLIVPCDTTLTPSTKFNSKWGCPTRRAQRAGRLRHYARAWPNAFDGSKLSPRAVPPIAGRAPIVWVQHAEGKSIMATGQTACPNRGAHLNLDSPCVLPVATTRPAGLSHRLRYLEQLQV